MKIVATLFAAFAFVAFSAPAQAADAEAGKAKFQQLCASCHGASGKGDGPAGKALDPQPRDMTAADWQDSVSDEHIAKVIKEGGAAAGLSALMPPWGHSLSDADVQNLVAYIRSLKGQ